MTETVWINLIDNLPAIIAAFASVLTAVGVIIVAYLNYRTNKLAKAAVEQGTVNAAKLQTVEASVNGQSEKLLELTRVSSKAEGILQEKESQQTLSIPDVVNVKLVEEE